MRAFLLSCLLLVLVTPAWAGLDEPPTNTGATAVEVDGTRLRAEAWAVALGHEVEAVVVGRLVTREGAEPVVTTYERWTLDGRKKFERGDKALGRFWEKRLWKELEDAEKRAAEEPRRRPRKDFLERWGGALGRAGSRILGDEVVSWSVGVSRIDGGGRPSVARVAVITLRPHVPGAGTPEGPGRRPVTPSMGGEVPEGVDVPERVRRALEGASGAAPGPTTPGEPGADPGHGRPRPRRGSGSGHASARGSGSGHASTEDGVREHALAEVDLGAGLRGPGPDDAPPAGETTPSDG